LFSRWGISNLDPSVDFGELIAATSARADRLAATLVGLYPRHVAMEHAVLSLYEGLARHLAGMGTVASVPALPLYAFTLHATTIVSVSRLCGLIQDLRHAFEHHNAVGAKLPAVDGGLESKFYDLSASFFEEENLSILNSRVTLVANLIWLGKIVTEDEAVGSLPPGLEQ
jgi:centromere protein I